MTLHRITTKALLRSPMRGYELQRNPAAGD